MKIERTIVVKIKNAENVDEKVLSEFLDSLSDNHKQFEREFKDEIDTDEVEILSDEILIDGKELKILKEGK